MERRFGGRLLRDRILFRAQAPDAFDMTLTFAHVVDHAQWNMTVACWIGEQVILMFGLRNREIAQILDLNGRSRSGALREFVQRLLIHRALLGGMRTGRIQSGTVLRPDVVALTVDAEWIDDAQEQQGQCSQTHPRRIVIDAHRFHGVGRSRTHHAIGGIRRNGLRVSHRGVKDAIDILHGSFESPEASAGHIGHMRLGGGRLRPLHCHLTARLRISPDPRRRHLRNACCRSRLSARHRRGCRRRPSDRRPCRRLGRCVPDVPWYAPYVHVP